MVAAVGKIMTGFSENLKRLREARGWTQTHLAKLTNIPWRTIQSWEIDRREASLGAAVVLAEAFEVPVTDLLAGEGDVFRKRQRDKAKARAKRKKTDD